MCRIKVTYAMYLALLCLQTAGADPYRLDRAVLSGGGGSATSEDQALRLKATMGQHDMRTVSGGDFSLTGGFLAGAGWSDCNDNSIPDSTEIAMGTSPDCDTNGVPDECQLVGNDCNSNGVPDHCDIADGIVTDCNGNGTPDACEGAVLITDYAYLSPYDLWMECRDVIVDGVMAELNIDGAHTFNSLQVINGGTITHPEHSTTEEDHGVDLAVTEDLLIDAASSIDVTGRGYGPARGPGCGTTRTFYDEVNWPTRGGGGGYGGQGGRSSEMPGGTAYGSASAPVHVGSGGGNGSSTMLGGAGGGLARLTVAGGLIIDGAVKADGQDAPSSWCGGVDYTCKAAGGGSGGGVWISAGTISGTGLISAGGGQGTWMSGGGGGGRIAIHSKVDSFGGTISAYGGDAMSGWEGGAGTIFIKPEGAPGQLTIDFGDRTGMPTQLNPTFWSGTDPFDLNIAGGARVQLGDVVIVHDALIGEGCVLGENAADVGLHLVSSGDLTILEGGMVTVYGRGYGPEEGPGAGLSNSVQGGGGAHGGDGGAAADGTAGGGAYGPSFSAPTSRGSGGGGAGYNQGGAGGGKLRLEVEGTLHIDGVLSADGSNAGSYNRFGGGAGGSIWITTDVLEGTGTVRANGGNGRSSGGGGGGGRIAVYYNEHLFAGTVSACGGTSSDGVAGGAGTVFTRDLAHHNGNLLVENCGRAGAHTPTTSAETCAQILVQEGSRFLFAGTFPSADLLTVGDGGSLLTEQSTDFVGNVEIQAGGQIALDSVETGIQLSVNGTMTVAAGGTINANAAGYGPGQGPGAGKTSSGIGGGGGYGGVGAGPSGVGGSTYGCAAEPIEPGSGGGNSSTYKGGAGGGRVRLSVTEALTIDGSIGADGGTGTGWCNAYGCKLSGGGSGGSIWIDAGSLTGMGTITAGGGKGGSHYSAYGGGGGGGRIAVYTCDLQMDPSSFTVVGGIGLGDGMPGTIVVGSNSIAIERQPQDVVVDLGEPAFFTILASGDGPLSYQWRKEGVDLSEDGHFSGVHTEALAIDMVDPDDLGTYDVVLTDACGSRPSTEAVLMEAGSPDVDGNGVVELEDHAIVASCMQGPDTAASEDCMLSDFDHNGYVDLKDWARLQRAFGSLP